MELFRLILSIRGVEITFCDFYTMDDALHIVHILREDIAIEIDLIDYNNQTYLIKDSKDAKDNNKTPSMGGH